MQTGFIHLSSPSQKDLCHVAAPKKLSIFLVTWALQPNAAFLHPGKVRSCTAVKNNTLHHSVLILALQDTGRAMGILLTGIPSPPLWKAQLSRVSALEHVRRWEGKCPGCRALTGQFWQPFLLCFPAPGLPSVQPWTFPLQKSLVSLFPPHLLQAKTGSAFLFVVCLVSLVWHHCAGLRDLDEPYHYVHCT